jgi:hypothetical protein
MLPISHPHFPGKRRPWLVNQIKPYVRITYVPPPPPVLFPVWQNWTLRDYWTTAPSLVKAPNQAPRPLSIPPPAVWQPWTLRDYWTWPVLSTAPSNPNVPASEIIAFGELPRDMTIWRFALPTVRIPNQVPKPLSSVPQPAFPIWALRDYSISPPNLTLGIVTYIWPASLIVTFPPPWTLNQYGLIAVNFPHARPTVVTAVETYPIGFNLIHFGGSYG